MSEFDPNDLSEVVERMAERMTQAFEMLSNFQADLMQLKSSVSGESQATIEPEQAEEFALPDAPETQFTETPEQETQLPDVSDVQGYEPAAEPFVEPSGVDAASPPQAPAAPIPSVPDAEPASVPNIPEDLGRYTIPHDHSDLLEQVGTTTDSYMPQLNEEFEDPELMSGTSFLQNNTERRFRDNAVSGIEELSRLAIDHDYRLERVLDALRSRK